MRIFLIGFMCSGKTTLGRALAKRMSLPFFDLDDLVEAEAGMSISEIFKAKGEESFRALEAETLAKLACGHDAIIACGGGTPCRQQAWDAIRSGSAFSVWLKPEDSQRLTRRLMEGRAKRPLISAIETAEEMDAFAKATIEKRTPHYQKADAMFDSSYLENEEEIAVSVDKFIDLLRQNGK